MWPFRKSSHAKEGAPIRTELLAYGTLASISEMIDALNAHFLEHVEDFRKAPSQKQQAVINLVAQQCLYHALVHFGQTQAIREATMEEYGRQLIIAFRSISGIDPGDMLKATEERSNSEKVGREIGFFGYAFCRTLEVESAVLMTEVAATFGHFLIEAFLPSLDAAWSLDDVQLTNIRAAYLLERRNESGDTG